MNAREELLLRMYRQMFADVENHFSIAWQSIAMLVGSIGLVALSDSLISLDLGASFVIILAAWMILTFQDAGFWYNRNLIIVANIERQFLTKDDLKDIHFYFRKHRPKNKTISHLKIQMYLGFGIGAVILCYHFANRILPGLSSPISEFDPARGIPLIVAACAIFLIIQSANHNRKKYSEFLRNSPGIDVDTDGIEYKIGHGGESD